MWGTVGRRDGPRAWGVIFRVGGRGGIPTWANVGRPMTWVRYYATPRRGTWANVGPRGTSHDFVTLVQEPQMARIRLHHHRQLRAKEVGEVGVDEDAEDEEVQAKEVEAKGNNQQEVVVQDKGRDKRNR